MKQIHYDVIIIGSGPTGIAAATALVTAGVEHILILEREATLGGVPRHCHHPSFGMLHFKWPMTGPRFIKRIMKNLKGVTCLTHASVTALKPNGVLTVSTPEGMLTFEGKRVILALGAREKPRHPRLVSGLRPQGILTTGALQQCVYLNKQKPGKNVVIVGTETVSYSALWTLFTKGLNPVAMVESGPNISGYPFFKGANLMTRTPIHYNSKIVDITGLDRVTSVVIDKAGQLITLECDTLLFTGAFVGESTLVRHSHLAHKAQTGVPEVDATGCCSDPTYYAGGNLLHPVDMGDQCYREGLVLGAAVAHSLSKLVAAKRIPIIADARIQFTVPMCLDLNVKQPWDLNLRVTQPLSGTLQIKAGDHVIYEKTGRFKPVRRIMLKDIPADLIPAETTAIQLNIV